MIVQACLNGARTAGYHPALPLTPEAIARDAAICVATGANELHIHPRGPDLAESLGAINATIPSVRAACPGTLVGVSTGAWIEKDAARTRDLISGWSELPDYASVNLSEPDAPAVMDILDRIGVGIEAGIATVEGAERFVSLARQRPALRILIEINEQNPPDALALAEEISAVLARSQVNRPILLHGFDATIWDLVRMARRCNWSTRIGLEDGKHMPDGSQASGNRALVAAAIAICRGQ
ncbi:3-keto-5-aminohexanoate cleavage protein [Pseudohoeflea suaedae]|uniref:3-keto-5-aminohexanoate cleavage protein n=1 Tax=Pseudohoeflea suaedae TaxID=877384 RepID=A0A4R5PJP5_9HYPH|nr:3-keto-5-aminohexanoate cleavage protein [Pseudohoeflea suaedae]TDH35903.1 3-keto-5-aminohexanoate cleavage protein [Pseudohoeflea suaedae]